MSQYTLEEIINYELPTATGDLCDGSVLALLSAHYIHALGTDPCAFEVLEAGGVKCSKADTLDNILLQMKCVREFCAEQAKSEAYCCHTRKAKPCKPKCCKTRRI